VRGANQGSPKEGGGSKKEGTNLFGGEGKLKGKLKSKRRLPSKSEGVSGRIRKEPWREKTG